jgi:hypothetical protein
MRLPFGPQAPLQREAEPRQQRDRRLVVRIGIGENAPLSFDE